MLAENNTDIQNAPNFVQDNLDIRTILTLAALFMFFFI